MILCILKVIYNFIYILKVHSIKQAVQNLVRCHILQCLIGLYAVYHCSIKWMLGLYELMICLLMSHEMDARLRPNKKKISVFRVTRPYLDLLVKSRILFRFLEKI